MSTINEMKQKIKNVSEDSKNMNRILLSSFNFQIKDFLLQVKQKLSNIEK